MSTDAYKTAYLLLRCEPWTDPNLAGLSSDAMVIAAATGRQPTWTPSDMADLSRCYVTRMLAPQEWWPAMDSILPEFERVVAERYPEAPAQARERAHQVVAGLRERIESFAAALRQEEGRRADA
ncbi:hypothetical protein SK069_05950 [Patulibacter brassicae]|uniref:Uncharacterized protein n=1 Tax=Patulibacter brassicae TaxID=1705717 RepID=A0ABU4VJR5_9ACTN|nr:hypothetical protein [Patulibacter brassicae]MDX8151128.1 hypothetical protein [Patulibacter brassicae]